MDYKYYVYVGPGHIEYFYSLVSAQNYASYYPGTEVKEIK